MSEPVKNAPAKPKAEEEGSPVQSFLAIFTSNTLGVVKTVNGVAVAEDIPSPEINTAGHCCLSLTFVAASLAYTILAIYAFATRPDLEVFTQQPTSRFPKITVGIDTACSNRPYCGNTTIVSNWTVATGSECVGNSTSVLIPEAQNQAERVYADLCFVGDQSFSTESRLPFNIEALMVDMIVNPGETDAVTQTPAPERKASGQVTVTSPQDPKFARLVTLDTWQVKTLVIGMNVKRRDGVIYERSLYPIAIQYDGKRPSWRATLIVAFSPLANVYDVSRPGTPLDVISSIGGAVSLISGALLLITPIIGCVCAGEEAGSKDEAIVVEDDAAEAGAGSSSETPPPAGATVSHA